MAETTPINFQAFEPFNGGAGARLVATAVTSNVAIPGLEGGVNNDKRRVLITNAGGGSVYIRMGNASVVAEFTATKCSQEIMGGTQVLLKPPNVGTQPVYMAAITESGSIGVSVCSGEGT